MLGARRCCGMVIKILLVILLLCAPMLAQSAYEYGGPADLKGATDVYIIPDTDMDDQERIKKTVLKAALPVKFVSSPDDADIILAFGGDTDVEITGVTWSAYGANTVRVPLEHGTGVVLVPGKEKPRLVLRVSNSQQTKWEKRPITKFVNAFIKTYREANGLPQK